jgi:hypothetical protein
MGRWDCEDMERPSSSRGFLPIDFTPESGVGSYLPNNSASTSLRPRPRASSYVAENAVNHSYLEHWMCWNAQVVFSAGEGRG